MSRKRPPSPPSPRPLDEALREALRERFEAAMRFFRERGQRSGEGLRENHRGARQASYFKKVPRTNLCAFYLQLLADETSSIELEQVTLGALAGHLESIGYEGPR